MRIRITMILLLLMLLPLPMFAQSLFHDSPMLVKADTVMFGYFLFGQYPTFAVKTVDGGLLWGSGTKVVDTRIARTGTATLQIYNNLVISNNLTTKTFKNSATNTTIDSFKVVGDTLAFYVGGKRFIALRK